MAEKIIQLLEDKSEYKKISRQGIRYVSQFTWDRFVDAHIKVYERL